MSQYVRYTKKNRKVFNVKSNENVRLCTDMFKCGAVDMLVAKRKQKFVGSLVRIWTICCANW